MAEELFKIFIGRGTLDDDYTFYDDGSVLREYDQSAYKLNLQEEIQANEISDHRKDRLLEKCPAQNEEKLRQLLYPNEK